MSIPELIVRKAANDDLSVHSRATAIAIWLLLDHLEVDTRERGRPCGDGIAEGKIPFGGRAIANHDGSRETIIGRYPPMPEHWTIIGCGRAELALVCIEAIALPHGRRF